MADGEGLAFVTVVVDEVFECVADVFDVPVFDGAVVDVDDEFVTVADEFIIGRFVLVLELVSPPQAIPNAVKAKSPKSAIAFFIFKTFSCLLQRLI